MPADIRDTETEHAPRVRATPARQGRMGRDVFVVLIASLLLALVAVFGSWIWNSGRIDGTESDASGHPVAAARSTDAPVRAPLAVPPASEPQR